MERHQHKGSLAEQGPCVVDRPVHLCTALREHGEIQATCMQVDAGVTSGYILFYLAILVARRRASFSDHKPPRASSFLPWIQPSFYVCSVLVVVMSLPSTTQPSRDCAPAEKVPSTT